MLDTLSSPGRLPHIDRSKAVTFIGGSYEQNSAEKIKIPPHVLGTYSCKSPEGYVGGGMEFARRDDLTLYQNGKVCHEIGWFATETDGITLPLMNRRYVREGKVDEFDKAKLTYIPSNDIAKIVPPLEEIGDKVVILGGKNVYSAGEFSVWTDTLTGSENILPDGTKEWQGSRLLIRDDNTAVLEVGTFLTTGGKFSQGGFTKGVEVKKYVGTAEIIELKFKQAGNSYLKPELFAFKFTPQTKN